MGMIYIFFLKIMGSNSLLHNIKSLFSVFEKIFQIIISSVFHSTLNLYDHFGPP